MRALLFSLFTFFLFAGVAMGQKVATASGGPGFIYVLETKGCGVLKPPVPIPADDVATMQAWLDSIAPTMGLAAGDIVYTWNGSGYSIEVTDATKCFPVAISGVEEVPEDGECTGGERAIFSTPKPPLFVGGGGGGEDPQLEALCEKLEDLGMTADEILACLEELKAPDEFIECWKSKLLLYGLENTSLSWRFEYTVEFTLAGGGTRVCTLPASTGWGPQMVAWEAALKDCFPEACLVERRWADWRASQLPQNGLGAIPQTSFVDGNDVCPPLTGQYIEFQLCPSTVDLMPIGAVVIATDHPNRADFILRDKVGETEEELIYRCITCDEQPEPPKCAILKGEEWPETPTALCQFDSQPGCDNLGWVADPEDPDAEAPEFPNITRVITFCDDGTKIVEYLVEDEDGNLDDYNNGNGLIGQFVDCDTLEVIEEPEAPIPPCDVVPVIICGKAPIITDTLKGFRWTTDSQAIDTSPPPQFEVTGYLDAFSTTDADGLPWHPNPFDECISLPTPYLNEANYFAGTNPDQLIMEGYLWIPASVTSISLETYGPGYSWEALYMGADSASATLQNDGFVGGPNTLTTKPFDLTDIEPDECYPDLKCIYFRAYSSDGQGLGRIYLRGDIGNGMQSLTGAGIRLSESKEIEEYTRIEWVECGTQPKLLDCEEICGAEDSEKVCEILELLSSVLTVCEAGGEGEQLWTIYSKLSRDGNEHPDFPGSTWIASEVRGDHPDGETGSIGGWSIYAICSAEKPTLDSNGHDWLLGGADDLSPGQFIRINDDPECKAGDPIDALAVVDCLSQDQLDALLALCDKQDLTNVELAAILTAILAQTDLSVYETECAVPVPTGELLPTTVQGEHESTVLIIPDTFSGNGDFGNFGYLPGTYGATLATIDQSLIVPSENPSCVGAEFGTIILDPMVPADAQGTTFEIELEGVDTTAGWGSVRAHCRSTGQWLPMSLIAGSGSSANNPQTGTYRVTFGTCPPEDVVITISSFGAQSLPGDPETCDEVRIGPTTYFIPETEDVLEKALLTKGCLDQAILDELQALNAPPQKSRALALGGDDDVPADLQSVAITAGDEAITVNLGGYLYTIEAGCTWTQSAEAPYCLPAFDVEGADEGGAATWMWSGLMVP